MHDLNWQSSVPLFLASSRPKGGTAVNLSTTGRIRMTDTARQVLDRTGDKADIKFCLEMPVGPQNPVTHNRLAKRLLGWEPRVKFPDGLCQTIGWCLTHKNIEEIKNRLAHQLTER
jgi:nucleoside-diphosphate-sugar epimerase